MKNKTSRPLARNGAPCQSSTTYHCIAWRKHAFAACFDVANNEIQSSVLRNVLVLFACTCYVKYMLCRRKCASTWMYMCTGIRVYFCMDEFAHACGYTCVHLHKHVGMHTY